MNHAAEAGLEFPLARALEDELARRGLLCGSGESASQLAGSIDVLGSTPAVLSPSPGTATGVAAYRVAATVRLALEVNGDRVWEAEPVLVQAEMPVGLEVTERVGLERSAGIRDRWETMSREAAERLILQLVSGF